MENHAEYMKIRTPMKVMKCKNFYDNDESFIQP